MKPDSRAALFAVLIGVLGVVAPSVLHPARAHAYCRMTTKMQVAGTSCTEAGIPLAWRRQCMSFSLVSRKESDPPLDQVRNTADFSFNTWEQVTCDGHAIGIQLRQTVALAVCETPEYNQHAGNANTVVFVEDWAGNDLPPDAFGITQVWHNPDTGEILDADMRLNETLGQFGICDQICKPGVVDIQNVMTHEAGHFLGLGHSDVTGATMSARAVIGETSKRSLADDDMAGVCAIYGNDGAADCSPANFTPNHGFSPDCAPEEAAPKSGLHCSATTPGAERAAGGTLAFAALCLLVGIARTRRKRAR